MKNIHIHQNTILKQKGDKLLSGSYVVSGRCYSKVEKVGKDNFAAQITSETKKYKRAESELVNSMKKVTNFTICKKINCNKNRKKWMDKSKNIIRNNWIYSKRKSIKTKTL